MKKVIFAALVLVSFASCKQMCPKMYTTYDKNTNLFGSFYSMSDIKIGIDTTIEGRHVQIIHVN